MNPALSRFIAVAALALVAMPAAWADECKLQRGASIDLINRPGTSPAITGSIAGKTVNFVVDTGASWSFLGPGASDGLPRVALPRGLKFIDIAGLPTTTAVRAPELSFGPFHLQNPEFVTGAVSLLGTNFLGAFDIEIDPVDKKLNIFKQNKCGGLPAYWPHQDVVIVPFSKSPWGNIIVPVTLDGVTLRALFDTGSGEALLNDRVARGRFDLTLGGAGTEASTTITGVAGRPIDSFRHQFGKLELGDLTIMHPWFRVFVPKEYEKQEQDQFLLQGDKPADIILGMSVIAALHVYIAYGEDKLYITTVQGDIAAGRLTAAGAAPANPLEAINRNEMMGGAADAMRAGDLPQTLAKLDQLVAATPNDPALLLARALYRRKAHDEAGAQADIDRAGTLAPKNANGFMARGVSYEGVGKFDLALRDLDQSIRLAPAAWQPLDARGTVHGKMKQFDLAMQDFDAALRLVPKSARILNDRCWTQAMANHLDGALADCNAALALAPTQPQVLDSRGFVQLKAGNPAAAIADYNAALALAPKHASSLYGRSLAKRQSGDVKGADADLAAARAFDPEIEQDFGT